MKTILQEGSLEEKRQRYRMSIIALTVLLLLALMTSCSGKGSVEYDDSFNLFSSDANSGTAAPAAPQNAYDMAMTDGQAKRMSTTIESQTSGSDTEQNTGVLGEMLIYTAEVELESSDYDKTITGFQAMIKEYSAFFENTYVSGINNLNVRSNQMRYANYTVRVPKAYFQMMLDRFYEIGNVLYISTRAENITAQFYDTDSRLKTYRTEETRLLAMMEKTNTVEEMIQVESRLSEVRYQIESLTATLRNWQNQVDYCTIEIRIREVVRLSDSSPQPRTYAEELGYGVVSTINIMGDFFKDLLKAIVVLSPLFLVLAVILAAIVLIVKNRRKREKLRADAAPEEQLGGAKMENEN